MGAGFTSGAGVGGRRGSVNTGKTDSNYASVTNQAGIFAGDGGFNIKVAGNTDLKGAVIASDATPDKNKISTGGLLLTRIFKIRRITTLVVGKEVLGSMEYRIIEYYSKKGLEFEFVGLEEWADFEILAEILEKHLKCTVIEKYDGPYSRFCKFEKDGLEFRLMQHSELGNALLAMIQNDENNQLIRKWANDVLNAYNTVAPYIYYRKLS